MPTGKRMEVIDEQLVRASPRRKASASRRLPPAAPTNNPPPSAAALRHHDVNMPPLLQSTGRRAG